LKRGEGLKIPLVPPLQKGEEFWRRKQGRPRGAKPLLKQIPLPLSKGKGIKGMGFKINVSGVR
jgi:hypothetical protein